VCIALCTIVAHNIAQNRPDNFPSYPTDNRHCSDDVYLTEGDVVVICLQRGANDLHIVHLVPLPPHQSSLASLKSRLV